MKKIYQLSIIFSLLLSSKLVFAESPVTTTANSKSAEDLLFILICLILLIGMVLITITIFRIYAIIEKMTNPQKNRNETYVKAMEERTLWQKMMGLSPLQFEKDNMIEHTYDGIAEIDNPIPGWFMYLFYATIVSSVIYLFVYHVAGNGKIMETEYKQQMDEGNQIKDAYMKKFANLVNENNIVLLKDAKGIEAGKAIFSQNCVACHLADGGGSVGPNLTDEYWLHGGSVKAVFHTISEGVPEKGMISWKKILNPMQIQQVESFVFSLKGIKPLVAKEPQGVKDDGSSSSVMPKDSTKNSSK